MKNTFLKYIFVSLMFLYASNSNAEEPEYLKGIFTHGTFGNPDNTLVDHIRTLLQKAAPGSNIKISVFLFAYRNMQEPILLDMLSAAERGVNVQILVDLPENEFPEKRGFNKRFREQFAKRLLEAGKKGKSDSWLKASEAHKNHTKIFLFSDSDNHKHWVITGSENLTDPSREKHQASIILRDKKIYKSHEKYWQQINNSSYDSLWIDNSNPDLVTLFFPQLEGNDIIYDRLDQLAKPDKRITGNIYVSMARWNHNRFGIAMKLVQLANMGFNVEVVTRENPKIVAPEIIWALKDKKNISLLTNDVSNINIHSKYMLFDLHVDNKPFKQVWVGSHNFTGKGLRKNYETWSEINSDSLFQEYKANFDFLKKISSYPPEPH